jgi:hypothetical protein
MPLRNDVRNHPTGRTIHDPDLRTPQNRPATAPDSDAAETGSGGSLVFSNLPETVETGDNKRILCHSPISANSAFRVYLHHRNNIGAAGSSATFRIIIRNQGAAAVNVTLNFNGSAVDSVVARAGKTALAQYLADTTPGNPQQIPAGGQWSLPVGTCRAAAR